MVRIAVSGIIKYLFWGPSEKCQINGKNNHIIKNNAALF